MQTGILTSVTYPTGGRTEFTYEAHRYIDDHGVSRMAGGLRIKQIRDIESDGNAQGAGEDGGGEKVEKRFGH